MENPGPCSSAQTTKNVFQCLLIHFSPSNEILSYSVSLQRLQNNNLQDMQNHRQKVMSETEGM